MEILIKNLNNLSSLKQYNYIFIAKGKLHLYNSFGVNVDLKKLILLKYKDGYEIAIYTVWGPVVLLMSRSDEINNKNENFATSYHNNYILWQLV